MKDRARALISLVSGERNRIYGAHRIFLRALCKMFPDVESEIRQIVTAKAQALIGKKGRMVHQEYRPEEPSIDQELNMEVERIEGNVDYKSCLKGIAKRLIVNQSNPSNGNVAQLISLSNSALQLKIALRVLSAQRWHLRAGHELLSSLFLTKTIQCCDEASPDWYKDLSEFLESSVSRSSNHAVVLTPKTIIAAIEAISQRIKLGSNEPERLWTWTAIAFRFYVWLEAYSGKMLEGESEVSAAYASFFAIVLLRLEDSAFKIPNTELILRDHLESTAQNCLYATNIAKIDDFLLATILKGCIRRNETIPDFIKAHLSTKLNYLHLFLDPEADIPVDPQQHDRNIRKFLKLSN